MDNELYQSYDTYAAFNWIVLAWRYGTYFVKKIHIADE